MRLAQGIGISGGPRNEITLPFICSVISSACPCCGLACPVLTYSFEKPDNVIKNTETRVKESTFEPFQNTEKILFKAVYFNKTTY